MPKPLDPEKREAIEADIRAGLPRNHIARDHDVSGSTVTKIAKHLEATDGVPPAFDRAQTKHATAARNVDLAARRAELAVLLMGDAFVLRERMWQDQVDYVNGGETGARRVLRPTNAGEFRNFLTAVGIAVDKVGVLTRSADGSEVAATLLGSLVDELRATRAAQ